MELLANEADMCCIPLPYSKGLKFSVVDITRRRLRPSLQISVSYRLANLFDWFSWSLVGHFRWHRMSSTTESCYHRSHGLALAHTFLIGFSMMAAMWSCFTSKWARDGFETSGIAEPACVCPTLTSYRSLFQIFLFCFSNDWLGEASASHFTAESSVN